MNSSVENGRNKCIPLGIDEAQALKSAIGWQDVPERALADEWGIGLRNVANDSSADMSPTNASEKCWTMNSAAMRLIGVPNPLKRSSLMNAERVSDRSRSSGTITVDESQSWRDFSQRTSGVWSGLIHFMDSNADAI